MRLVVRNNNDDKFIDGYKIFDRKKARIKSSSLIDNESMFYNPYKKSVTFRSHNGSKVVSKNCII